MPELFATEAAPKGRSFVQRLDVRTKMGISLSVSVAVVFMSHPWALGVLAVAGLFYAAMLKRPWILLIIYAVVALMWFAAIGMTMGMHALWPKSPPVELHQLVAPFLRTVVMINVALALALSSRIQSVLATLKALRLPFCIYVPLAVMIRFLPVFIEDIRQISECIRTRGLRLSPVGLVTKPLLTIRLLLIPLLFRSLRSSDELGMAAELKGLGRGRKITPLNGSRFTNDDALMAGLALVVLIIGTALQLILSDGQGGML